MTTGNLRSYGEPEMLAREAGTGQTAQVRGEAATPGLGGCDVNFQTPWGWMHHRRTVDAVKEMERREERGEMLRSTMVVLSRDLSEQLGTIDSLIDNISTRRGLNDE